MVVDHDHATGRLRSWLCNECNVLVGMGAECPTILSNARHYVIKHQAISTMEEICSSLPHAAATLAQSIEAMAYHPYTYAVFGAMSDKDIEGVLQSMLED